MRVIICGAGRVGYGIAARLASERADVTIIDQSAKLVHGVTERLDVQGIVGSGSYPDILRKAGASDADMVIAVTHSDEVNIVACQICHSLFSVPMKIARIRAGNYLDQRYSDIFSRNNIPIDVVISPEQEVANAVLQRMRTPAAFEVKSFIDNRVWALGVSLDENCPVLDTPLKQIDELFPELAIKIVAVRRAEKIIRLHSDDQLMNGDDVFFIAEESKVDKALQILREGKSQARKVILIGGGNIGYHVAAALQHDKSVKIRLIEQNVERATEVAENLSRTIVLHGSGLDRNILREAGVADAEGVVALTDNDQVNVLSAVIAKREGARRTMSLINEPEYGPLSRSLGIEGFIDPRATTVSTILQHIRRGRIKSVYSILDGQVELVDAVALDTSALVGKPLKDVGLSAGIVLGAVMRGDEVILPDAQTVIRAGDRVVLMALNDCIKEVEQLFRVSIDYF